jgi:hypothetical protein
MTTKNNDSFRVAFGKIIEKTQGKTDTFCRMVALGLLTKLIEKSPVDTGRFKNNWFVALDSINLTQVQATDKTGQLVMARGTAIIEEFTAGHVVNITNSLPYAKVLEFGEYGNPPGSANGEKTVSGYSKQAPEGMVRITMAEMTTQLNQIAKKLRDT